MNIFRGRGVFIDVYKADDKIATSGTTLLADTDLRRIDSVATGRIPSLFCGANDGLKMAGQYQGNTITFKKQTVKCAK